MPSRTSRPRAPIQVPAGVVRARGIREDRTMADETMAEETIRWFAGIDWGSAKHQACLLDGAGRVWASGRSRTAVRASRSTARGFLDTRYCYAAALIGARAANHSRL